MYNLMIIISITKKYDGGLQIIRIRIGTILETKLTI